MFERNGTCYQQKTIKILLIFYVLKYVYIRANILKNSIAS